ncbi:MAG: hypothetical protein AAGI23_14965 [Bacteroidota bacterium]
MLDWTSTDITNAIQSAIAGNRRELDRFFAAMYERAKRSLISLTQSEEMAMSCMADALVKFERLFVKEQRALPQSNIPGYLFMIAKSKYFDELRRQKKENELKTNLKVIHNSAVYEEGDMEYIYARREQAMQLAIGELSAPCQQLFTTILKEGTDKPQQLYELLGWENSRKVSERLYDCKKQLKIKAAIQLERLERA